MDGTMNGSDGAAPSPSLARRDLLLGGALLATAGVAFARLPRERIVAFHGSDMEKAIPARVGAWAAVPDEGFVMPPEDEQKAAAVYESQLARTYANGSDAPIMFVLAYDRSQSGMLMVHRPESCYPGSGFTITADRATDIPLARGLAPGARFLTAVRDMRVEQVLYWTRLGNGFPRSWDEERSELAMQNLRGMIPDGALVRLSAITPDAEAALAMLRRFAAMLYGACGRDGRALLAGPANA